MNLPIRIAILYGMALATVVPLRSQAVFGGELFEFGSMSTKTPPGICPLQAAVPTGATVVVIAAEDGNDYHVTNVTDSQGNSYTQNVYYHNTNYQPTEQSIWSARAVHALTTHDTVSITWSAATEEYRSYAVSVVFVTGVSEQPDGTAKNNAYMYTDAVSVPGKTAAGNTIILGLLEANDFVWAIGPGWSIYRTEAINIHYDFFYKVLRAAGRVDPGGTGPAAHTYSGIWAAFPASHGGTQP